MLCGVHDSFSYWQFMIQYNKEKNKYICTYLYILFEKNIMSNEKSFRFLEWTEKMSLVIRMYPKITYFICWRDLKVWTYYILFFLYYSSYIIFSQDLSGAVEETKTSFFTYESFETKKTPNKTEEKNIKERFKINLLWYLLIEMFKKKFKLI